jgi:hypothetical protein
MTERLTLKQLSARIDELEATLNEQAKQPPPNPGVQSSSTPPLWARYSKALAAFTPAVLLLLVAWLFNTPHVITDHERAASLLALSGPLGVAIAPKNAPKTRARKQSR